MTRRRSTPHPIVPVGLLVGLLIATVVCASATDRGGAPPSSGTSWHTDIPVTTFWVGEVFDPDARDGSQRISTYDARWLDHYGGCDGVVREGRCRTERRSADEGWFPTSMEPRENPFYVDVPYDDVNDPDGFAQRCRVVPWSDEPAYTGRCRDRSISLLKNRWVRVIGPSGRDCFGQVEDAGPAEYDDAAYVFGDDDARPRNRRFGGAGMDVSPALNGCLGLRDLDGEGDLVRWRFVDDSDVAAGPWREKVTTSGVTRWP